MRSGSRIGELPNLKILELSECRQGYTNFAVDHLSEMASLSSLEVLKVGEFWNAAAIIDELLREAGHQLKDLSINSPGHVKDMARFKNIERLQVHSPPSTSSYGSTEDVKPKYALRCVTEPPKLKDLKIHETPLKEVYKEELVSFLRTSDRKLRYNGSEFIIEILFHHFN